MSPIFTRARIANPRHKSKGRRAKAKARKARKSSRRTAHVRRRKHKSNPTGGELIMATNPHKRRGHRRHHKKHGNPVVKVHRRRSRRHKSHLRVHRRRHNPSSGLKMGFKDLLLGGVAAAGGAIGTRAVTQAILREKNTGAMGYGANLLAALMLGYGTAKVFKKNNLGAAVAIGGISATVIRWWTERISQTSASALSGLGDVDFSDDGLGGYISTGFGLPSISTPDGSGNYLVSNAPSSSIPAKNVPVVAGVNASRFSSRY